MELWTAGALPRLLVLADADLRLASLEAGLVLTAEVLRPVAEILDLDLLDAVRV